MRIFPADRQRLVYLNVLAGLYTSTAEDALIRIVPIKRIGIVNLVRFRAERYLLMFDLQQFRCVMDRAVAVAVSSLLGSFTLTSTCKVNSW
jgi:uncharacterized membrane protein